MRELPLVLTAVFSGLLAAGGFAADAWLDMFTPCRVSYRISDTVYGSLACQTYYAIALFSAVLAFAACGLAVIAGILFLVRRRTPG
ncbi:MAG: hypothetical protein ABI640_17425 [Gammaproteobacteria bacterium]